MQIDTVAKVVPHHVLVDLEAAGAVIEVDPAGLEQILAHARVVDPVVVNLGNRRSDILILVATGVDPACVGCQQRVVVNHVVADVVARRGFGIALVVVIQVDAVARCVEDRVVGHGVVGGVGRQQDGRAVGASVADVVDQIVGGGVARAVQDDPAAGADLHMAVSDHIARAIEHDPGGAVVGLPGDRPVEPFEMGEILRLDAVDHVAAARRIHDDPSGEDPQPGDRDV